MADPRRLFDSKDIQAAALYANQVTAGLEDFYPLKVDSNGYLLVSMTVGSVSLSSTASTITNAAGNPVPVSVVSPVDGSGYLLVNMTVGSVSLSSTASTITNAVSNPVNVSLTSTVVSVTLPPALTTTAVTVNNAVGNPVNVSVTNTAGTVTNSVSTIQIVGRTLTGSTGSLTATNGTISLTPTNRAKVYAFSLTTTSATEVTAIFHSGSVANGLELWRVTLMAPAGTNAGANLAVSPPNFLFASRSGTAVSLSLSTAALVHYSISYFDEA